jgi:hypothetical protein
VWKIEISGPNEYQRGQSFSLRLKTIDSNGRPLSGKTINYSGWYTRGQTTSTNTEGIVDLVITPLEAWNDITLVFVADYGLTTVTIKVKASTVSPTPTPTDSGAPSQRLVTPGAFCAATEAGTQGVSSTGIVYTCKISSTENRLRWRR